MNEGLAREAFQLLYPNRDVNSYKFSIKYNNRFKDYGANVKYSMNRIDFHLSKRWRHVNKNITMGLLHELFIKIFKTKNPHTLFYVDLYNAYVKNMHVAIPKTKTEPMLENSFQRVNNKYFAELVEQPNLVWGKRTKNKLGSYDYCTDTISINIGLKNKNLVFLDYVMHHEMLHKHMKFDKKGRYHTPEFRKREKQFENAHMVEKGIRNGCNFQKDQNFFEKLLNSFK